MPNEKDVGNIQVVRDGCRGVNLRPRDSDLAWQELQGAGAEIVISDDLLR
jgi:nicotinamidase-related amidase